MGAPKYTYPDASPRDGIHLARLIYVYGYSYARSNFYYPVRLDHDLTTGQLLGVVAVASDGEIVGHAGLERSDLGPLGELLAFAVTPGPSGPLRR